MARPAKTGLDYYPRNTDIYEDRKIRKLINGFGAKGFLIADYLLCLIYKDKGYWVQYDDDLKFDIADKFKSIGITENNVHEIILGSVRCGLFDEPVFNQFKVLTSNGIQKRYLLVRPKGFISENIMVLREETTVFDDLSTQSKVKESKEKESKELATSVFNSVNHSFTEKVLELWINICQTKKWIKKERTALELSLKKLSSYHELFAIHLLENAISNGYQGLVFSDTDLTYQKWQKANTNNSNIGIEDEATKRIREKLGR